MQTKQNLGWVWGGGGGGGGGWKRRISAYTVKKVIVFPVPSRDVTHQTLPGQELIN